jgi:hypothetical protein
MSEFQFYDFRAVERPLTKQEMAELRAVTSRAKITPRSLTNAYHYGDFKGSVDELMDRFFDGHLYYANWGTTNLHLRVPVDMIAEEDLESYLVEEFFTSRCTKTHRVLQFHLFIEGGNDYEDEEGLEDVLDTLMAIRQELLQGDLRCLYLGWLAGILATEVDPELPEPIVPAGLKTLSAAQQEFARRFDIEEELIAKAAERSPAMSSAKLKAADVRAWIKTLSVAEKEKALGDVMLGKGEVTVGSLLERFQRTQASSETDEEVEPRTAGELLKGIDRDREEA